MRLWYMLPSLGESSRDPPLSAYQLMLWETEFGFSDFFWRLYQTCLPTSRWVIYKHTCLHCTECSAIFDQKQCNPCAPPSLFTQSHPKWLFFVSLDEKSPQMEMFCWCRRGETNKQTKSSRSTKGNQNWWVQKLLSSGKKISISVLHQMESTLKVTEV